MLTIAHGSYCPTPSDPCSTLTSLGDVFVTESWGDQTGIRRFVIAADVLNLSAGWVPYNHDTGQGNYIWWSYHLTDFATVTEKVLRGAEVCTTYNRGSLNWGSQGGSWPVDGHPHGANYTVKITATSIYDPTIVVEKSVDVYVDTFSTHNPIITRSIRCKHENNPYWCDDCWQCIKKDSAYTIDVQAYDPDGDSITYEWRCGRGYLYTDEGQWDRWVTTSQNHVCYYPPPPSGGKEPPVYEWIEVNVIDPYGGVVHNEVIMDLYLYPSSYSCMCGDVNRDGNGPNTGDVVFLIAYVYKGGAPPYPPIERGDVNNDCQITLGDVIYLINYVYKGGPPPECCWIH